MSVQHMCSNYEVYFYRGQETELSSCGGCPGHLRDEVDADSCQWLNNLNYRCFSCFKAIYCSEKCAFNHIRVAYENAQVISLIDDETYSAHSFETCQEHFAECDYSLPEFKFALHNLFDEHHLLDILRKLHREEWQPAHVGLENDPRFIQTGSCEPPRCKASS